MLLAPARPNRPSSHCIRALAAAQPRADCGYAHEFLGRAASVKVTGFPAGSAASPESRSRRLVRAMVEHHGRWHSLRRQRQKSMGRGYGRTAYTAAPTPVAQAPPQAPSHAELTPRWQADRSESDGWSPGAGGGVHTCPPMPRPSLMLHYQLKPAPPLASPGRKSGIGIPGRRAGTLLARQISWSVRRLRSLGGGRIHVLGASAGCRDRCCG